MVKKELFGGAEFVLMSQSPRRKELLQKLGLPFRAISSDAVETYPKTLLGSEIPVFLSRLKANSYQPENDNGRLKEIGQAEKCAYPCIIAADTIVWAEGQALGKPKDAEDARRMLHILSGNTHKVITGVTLKRGESIRSFFEQTEVEFYPLTDSEIGYYISNFRPFDKAGAYGIQEWIGMIGVKRISGSFYNVMGLPVARLYHELLDFLL